MLNKKEILKLKSPKKFYFLDYFYILLVSIENYDKFLSIFKSFLELKQKYGLGESKYKKLSIDVTKSTKVQLDRYIYTFKQVVLESIEYNLIEIVNKKFLLKSNGLNLLELYKAQGTVKFNQKLFGLMEEKNYAFKYLINILYEGSKSGKGLFILPSYSPRQLKIEKLKMRTTADILHYAEVLRKQISYDFNKQCKINNTFKNVNKQIIEKLIKNGLIESNTTSRFNPKLYNKITNHFRGFWRNYLLREVYNFKYSLSSFDLWIYRGKQIGIVHATEFYPNQIGKVVFPTSIIKPKIMSKDFVKIMKYTDGNCLYVHSPKITSNNINVFVDYLVDSYFDIRRNVRSYFVNLNSVRELVCFKMKISETIFEKFLNQTYNLNIKGKLKIRIALEVDKLPEETKAIYLKQTPVNVKGKFYNILAIDLSKRGNIHE